MQSIILIFHSILMLSMAFFLKGPTTAKYHNYLNGKGAVVLDQSVGTLEMIDGSRFMNDVDGDLTIIITYGELSKGTLGIAMRGLKTCRIIVSHVMNPETSVSYDEKDLRSVLMHEIGHCFGLDHFDDENHIMYWAYDGNSHTYAQIEQLVKDLKVMRGVD